MSRYNNTVSFLVYGDRALFTDPVTMTGGERHTYPVPTYEALRGIMDNIYWKPTIRWHINRVRIMTSIQKETVAMRQIKYHTNTADRSYNTYLSNVAYQVEASFEWANPGPGFEQDRIPAKHLAIAKRSIQAGGRYEIFLGSRECAAYVEPCIFGEGEGAYDAQPHTNFGLMFHGYNYPEATGRNALEARLWHASMEYGVITFPRPESCPVTRYIRDMAPKTFKSKSVAEEPLPEVRSHDLGQPSILKKGAQKAVCSDFVPWEKKLCETYDNLLAADQIQEDTIGLLPICHIRKEAQIQIDIDLEGFFHFGTGKVLTKDEALTLIPCSTTSQFRTSSKLPHLLFDTLEYMASDYAKYSGKPGAESMNENYIKQLRRWANEPDTPASVKAIYTYLSRNSLISDLVIDGIIPVIESTKGEKEIPVNWSGDGTAPDIYKFCDPKKGPLSATVRIRVIQNGEPKDVWTDPEVQQSALRFNDKISRESGDIDICYVSGKKEYITTLHPYLRGTTKLISSNDISGFTYRSGNLNLPEHRVKIGYEASQKIHLALRWLLAHQSFTVGNQTYLLWSVHNHKIPSILWDNVSYPLRDKDEDPDISMQEYLKEVRNYIHGFNVALDPNDDVVLMSLATPSTGRVSITNYQPLQTSNLLDNIRKWHETCYGKLPIKDIGMVIRAPYIFEIVRVATGADNSPAARESVEKTLFSSIILGQPLPRNLIVHIFNNIVRAMSHPATGTHPLNQVDFNVAVAMIRKSLTDRGVDLMNEDRSTTFGRILAYCYEIERFSIYLSKSGYRTTNAEKLILQYRQQPIRTLDILSTRLVPYRNRIQRTVSGRQMLKELDALIASLSETDFHNAPLNERFVLGYHTQLSALRDRINNRKDE